jgi:pyruvate dehydrogenase complex dehydrogenase (E1) component
MLRRHALVTASCSGPRSAPPPSGVRRRRRKGTRPRPAARASAVLSTPAPTLNAHLPACRRICGIVSVLDGHPATLAWLGAVYGHKVRPLGVEHFGQTGTIPDLYRHYGIDANAVIAAAQALTPGAPIRHLKAI